MSKHEKSSESRQIAESLAAEEPAVAPMPATGCVICGSYEGEMSPVTQNARAHGDCAAKRPDDPRLRLRR